MFIKLLMLIIFSRLETGFLFVTLLALILDAGQEEKTYYHSQNSERDSHRPYPSGQSFLDSPGVGVNALARETGDIIAIGITLSRPA